MNSGTAVCFPEWVCEAAREGMYSGGKWRDVSGRLKLENAAPAGLIELSTGGPLSTSTESLPAD